MEGWYFTHWEISDPYNTGLCRDKGRKKLHRQTLGEAGYAAFLFLLSNSEGFENLFRFFFYVPLLASAPLEFHSALSTGYLARCFLL